MEMNRRSVLIGLGTAAAGSGAVFGSGAFTSVQADRSVQISLQNDSNPADSALALAPSDSFDSVTESGSTLNIDIDSALDGGATNADSTVVIGTADETSISAPSGTNLDLSDGVASAGTSSDYAFVLQAGDPITDTESVEFDLSVSAGDGGGESDGSQQNTTLYGAGDVGANFNITSSDDSFTTESSLSLSGAGSATNGSDGDVLAVAVEVDTNSSADSTNPTIQVTINNVTGTGS